MVSYYKNIKLFLNYETNWTKIEDLKNIVLDAL